MLLMLHIIIALFGLALAAMAAFKPSNTKVKASYGFLVGTLLSGVLLIFINNASILHTCVSGLTFTAVMYICIGIAQQKLALQQ